MPLKDKEAQKQYQKEWREKNKDKIAQQKREYREKNKDKIEQYNQEYYEKNKAKIQQRAKEYKKAKGIIKMKLKDYKENDKKHNREFDIDEDYVILLLQKQNNICNRCKKQVKLEWEDAYDKEQFSINRLDNSIGHIKSNVEMTCWGCNDRLGQEDRFNRGCLRKSETKYYDKVYYNWVFLYWINGEQQSKSFSINKYGNEKAHQMCIDLQNEIFPLTS